MLNKKNINQLFVVGTLTVTIEIFMIIISSTGTC